MAEKVRLERLEILEAASTLISIRRHCEERIQWQRSRNNPFLSAPPIYHPYFPNIWPFYKPAFPYDVTALPLMHHHHHHHPHFPFHQVSPYMVGPPRPWFLAPQASYPSPLRNTEVAAESLPSTQISSTSPRTSRLPAAVETGEGSLHDDNDDSGEQDEVSTGDKNDQKRKRRNLTKRQQEILERAYNTTKYPHIDERLSLGKATQLTEDRIQVWFQNRRAKDRRTEGIKSPAQKSAERENNDTLSQDFGAVHVKGGEGKEGKECLLHDDGGDCREPSPKRIKQEK